jgi:hypothetical protein
MERVLASKVVVAYLPAPALQRCDHDTGSLRLRLHVPFDKKEKAEVVTTCDHVKNLKLSCVLPTAFTEHAASWQQRDSILSGRLPPATGKARTASQLLVT